ncbi:MAG: MBL fold metallo-hydrolase [Actinomycetota bacterium]|nr:MBL fold metallo-hydrolase [Actinomycetota bacterium]
MNDLLTIDTHMQGHSELTGTFLVAGEQTALIETGPKSTVERVLAGLDKAGVESLDAIVLTHIHLDHAGAAGTLAKRFPDATVWVHGLGAPHLESPAKLWSSASRIYGDAMEQLWGGIDPLDRERIQIVQDGDLIDLGGRTLTAFETPGHASHHISYLDDRTGTMFTGDALGLRLPGVPLSRPTTPPPEFDIETAVASIERIRGLGAERLCFTHFGPSEDPVDQLCSDAIEGLRRWGGWIQELRRTTKDIDAVAAGVAERDRSHLDVEPQAATRLEAASSYRMNTWGYMRYFDKLEEN